VPDAAAHVGPGSTLTAPRPGFSRVVDLTHTLSPQFPTYSGVPEMALEAVLSYERDRKNVKRWLLQEHIGTHLDAPIHFSLDGQTADEVPVESLVVPLAVIDICQPNRRIDPLGELKV
jgi:kynurenine formamidase